MESQQLGERAFWVRFAVYLRDFGFSEVSPSKQIDFARSFVSSLDCRLVESNEAMVTAFFVEIGRDPSRTVVEASQAVDAVKFLLKKAKVSWVDSVDWEGHKASMQSLPPSHPTRLRRDTRVEGVNTQILTLGVRIRGAKGANLSFGFHPGPSALIPSRVSLRRPYRGDSTDPEGKRIFRSANR